MVRFGKPINAPGYTSVANERKMWEELKQQHMTYPWFVKELDEWTQTYKESMQNEDWRNKYNNVWCNKTNKMTYVEMTPEEWLYSHLRFIGNGIDDTKYDGPIMIPSWSIESRQVLEDILRERNKSFVYDVYKEKKEQNEMNSEDRCRKILVKFA